MRNRILLIIAMLALCTSAGASRKYVFKHFTIDEGLPDNSITSVARDRYGFLWFGSKTGICRFDGRNFIPLEEYNRVNKLGGWVFDMYEDKEGLMWFASHSGVGFYKPETGKITLIQNIDAAVDTHIEQDSKGAIWLTRSDIMYRYIKESGEIVSYPADKYFSVVSSCADSNGTIWFACNDGLVRRFDDNSNSFTTIPLSDYISTDSGELPYRIQTISGGQVLIGTTQNRILRMDVVSGAVEILPIEYDQADGVILQRIMERVPGEYWIATRRGLYIYDDKNKSTEHISNRDQWELEDMNVICMVADREENVWIGTFNAGLSAWYKNDSSMKKYFPDNKPGSIKGAQFHALAEDNSGNIWIGTQNGHLNKLGAADREIVEIADPALRWQNYYCILPVGNELWLGTYGNSIYIFDCTAGRVKGHKTIPGSERIVELEQAPDGTIYVGTSTGLYTYDPATDRFVQDKRLGYTMIHAINFASDGSLWIGSYRDGLFYLKPGSSQYEHIKADPENPFSLKSDYVTFLFEDIDHKIWIASEGGCLSCTNLNDPEHAIESFNVKDGFPTNTASSIIQDSRGYLWVGTTGGLVKFDPRSNSVVDIYYDPNETIGNCFTYDAVMKTSRGSVFMGTSKGVLAFYPEQLKPHTHEIPTYITDICTKDRERSESLFPEGVSPLAADELRIPMKKAGYLEFKYSSLCFSPDTPIVYEYSISHRGKKNYSVTESGSMVFSNLRQGHYLFKVRSAGSTDPSLEAVIRMHIVPPLWHCNMAILAYILFVIGGLWYGFNLRLSKLEFKRKAEMEEMQNARRQELFEAKINFFTNITHEIRTPLSLVKMPLDKIIRNKEYKDEADEDIHIIQRNISRLLEITNQLLNMRKMEAEAPEMQFVQCDINALTRECVTQFSREADSRHKKMKLKLSKETIEALVDKDAFDKIISNLISNAIKYSKENITIESSSFENVLRIHVDSDGKLIRGEDREHIFRPFIRLEEGRTDVTGTGLGLPYARTLASHMGGRLVMDDSRSGVNSFLVELPLVQAEIKPVQEVPDESPAITEEESTESYGKKPLILVVEDSEEMKLYIEKELSSSYRVASARNGEEALAIMSEKKIDIVVSDIMMPEMDGCELCNRIKSNVEFSHIPVILVTAAVGVEKRMESLRIGADGYIEKPFSIDLLKANISNLLRNREISYQQFTASPLSHFSSTVSSDTDDNFMEQLHEVIMHNMSDLELNIDELVDLMKISKSTLYRKIKANTGLNTSEYVRLCRLKKAAELLASQEYRINEVAYMVGFSSPSYFATAFQKQFKVSPSAFVKNLGEE